MSLARLRDVLAAVGIEPTARECADLLWLAQLSRQSAVLTGEPAVLTSPPPPDPAAGPLPQHLRRNPAPGPAEPRGTGTGRAATVRSEPPQDTVDLHLPARDGAVPGGTAAVRVAGVRALADPLALARALRPLKRQLPSASRQLVDEEATAQRAAEQQLWLPVSVPAPERWADLALVVDDGASMIIWRQFVRELRQLLEQLGAFRDLRQWRLDSERSQPVLRAETAGSATRDPRELVDPTGRRIVLIVSDCLGQAWRDGAMNPLLSTWGSVGPVAVLQPLPHRLWDRTGLPAISAELRADRPGQPNVSVHRRTAAGGHPVLPLLEVDGEWITPWAKLVANTSTGWTRLAIAGRSGPAASARIDRADAEQVIREFWRGSSPTAFRLAGYLSAVPISLPVMRLVQRVKLPGSRPSHLAEVFLGGLLRRSTALGSGVDADQVQYDFLPGVREVLLGTITRGDALGLLEEVAQFLTSTLGRPIDFDALLVDPQGPVAARLDESSRPFATVARTVLARLGQPGARAARTIQPDSSQPSPAQQPGRRPSRRRQVRVVGTNLPARTVFRPLLFVGLGGTGCRIGAELEQNLRAQLCGPDGTRLQELLPQHNLLPGQLPAFLQFVYADLDETAFMAMRERIAPDRTPLSTAANAHLTGGLIDIPRGYTQLARRLRRALPKAALSWLPNPPDEPDIEWLGATYGRVPTAVRAALFGALLSAPESILTPIDSALHNLAMSGPHRHALGVRWDSGLDVFVAFSAAGATGAGLFWDYLHLVSHRLGRAGWHPQIYPMVALSSVSEPHVRRSGVLNAGSALVDLCQLVDQQHGSDLDSWELAADPTLGEPSPEYPSIGPVRLRAAAVRTPVLFEGWLDREPARLHQSVASMVRLFSQANLDDDRRRVADDVANRFVEYALPAADGIGNRSLTTGLVTSLEIPFDGLVDVFSVRLLAAAIAELSEPSEEDNRQLIDEFFDRSNLRPLQVAAPPATTRAGLPAGADRLHAALTARVGQLQAALSDFDWQVDTLAQQLAAAFDPGKALGWMLPRTDLFRIWRVTGGHRLLADPVSRRGFFATLVGYADEPQPPDGVEMSPPAVPPLRDRPLFRPLRPSDVVVTDVLAAQDAWFHWRVRLAWHQAWRNHAARWQQTGQHCVDELQAIVEGFADYERQHRQAFTQQVHELTRSRLTVTHLLPHGGDLEAFYPVVFGRLAESLTGRAVPPRNAPSWTPHIVTSGQLVNHLLGGQGWLTAYQRGRENPRQAVLRVLGLLRQEVAQALRQAGVGQSALVPTLAEQLAAAAAGPRSTPLRSQLAALVPAGHMPAGSGTLRALVCYPARGRSPEVERFLLDSLNLPDEDAVTVEFHPATEETVTVALFRAGMSLSQLPPARDAVRYWQQALRAERPGDHLPWRQRLGDSGGLAATESQRAAILQRVLCALWNGQAQVEGTAQSPSVLRLRLDGVPDVIELALQPCEELPSWGSLLLAYEDWALADDQSEQRVAAAALLRTLPGGLSLARSPRPPAPLYRVLVDGGAEWAALARQRAAKPTTHQRLLRAHAEFWERTLPDALELPFVGIGDPVRANLRDLLGHVTGEPG